MKGTVFEKKLFFFLHDCAQSSSIEKAVLIKSAARFDASIKIGGRRIKDGATFSPFRLFFIASAHLHLSTTFEAVRKEISIECFLFFAFKKPGLKCRNKPWEIFCLSSPIVRRNKRIEKEKNWFLARKKGVLTDFHPLKRERGKEPSCNYWEREKREEKRLNCKGTTHHFCAGKNKVLLSPHSLKKKTN